MFTGIVEATAQITENNGDRLVIKKPSAWNDLSLGASISVAGVCLSIVELTDDHMAFDVVAETQSRTNLGSKTDGRINLERAVRADQRLDGHIVQGHVDGKGNVKRPPVPDRTGKVESGKLIVELPKELIKFCIQKGSITVDGVSLTIADITEDTVTIALIPHTLEHTTLGALEEGDSVNIETDIVGRYIFSFTHS